MTSTYSLSVHPYQCVGLDNHANHSIDIQPRRFLQSHLHGALSRISDQEPATSILLISAKDGAYHRETLQYLGAVGCQIYLWIRGHHLMHATHNTPGSLLSPTTLPHRPNPVALIIARALRPADHLDQSCHTLPLHKAGHSQHSTTRPPLNPFPVSD